MTIAKSSPLGLTRLPDHTQLPDFDGTDELSITLKPKDNRL
nr:hypothetical protein [Spirulina subsalsa]